MFSILGDISCIESLESTGASLILVVEKHAAMLRLHEDIIWSKMPMARETATCALTPFLLQILLTAKGFPDLASRQFLRSLVDTLHLPVYGLFDFNLGGYRVYETWSKYRVP